MEQHPKHEGPSVDAPHGTGQAEGGTASGPGRPSCSIDPGPRPFRVLLAEDDGEMRCVVAGALRGDGYDVIELSDGGRLLVEVAARLKAGGRGDPLDLIVSDIRMPVCSGLQILSAIRDARWRTPVILMTAFGDEQTRRDAESLAAVLFDKPFDLDDLRTAVANVLSRGPRRS